MIKIKVLPGTVHQVRLPAEVIYAGGLYQGVVTVTPRLGNTTVLPTENKILLQNITVLSIPVSRVNNAAGGVTVTVGGESND